MVLTVFLSTISNINNAIGLLYMIFIVTGFRFHPKKRYYRKLLEQPTLKLTHGIISAVLFSYGMIRIIRFNCFDVFLLTPFLFYGLLLFVDLSYRAYYGRTINLILRYDFEIDGELNIWDKIASILFLIIPVGLSFLIGFLIVE